MENKPLKVQIQSTFARILLSSIAATIITCVLVVALYLCLQYKAVYPPNYYEQQIPKIENYIQQENISLLSPSARNSLEQNIPMQGIEYQVIDSQCNILYGSIDKAIVQSKKQLYGQLNTLTHWQGHYIRTIPLIDEDNGKISGAVLLSYQVKITYTNNSDSVWLTILFILALASPFLYIAIFTIVFSKKFSNRINYPLKLLSNASKRIKAKDLDFEIDYHAQNELGDLCTAFSEMKEELKHSLSTQWEMEQDRTEMVESLAHDLKTPLSIIKSYSEALLDLPTGKDGRMSRYLSIIKENADKSAKLVRQMQYSSDLEKDAVPLHLAPVNITDFMEQRMRYYELQARQKKVKLSLQMDGDTQTSFLSDTEKIERILDNLVSNSLQYTPNDGEISIAVNVEHDRVYYKISDSGSGFSKRDMEKAFEKFYRGDSARTQKDGNSGLGLYISKQLVEKLGGSIKISNTEAGGACIEFWHKVFENKEHHL